MGTDSLGDRVQGLDAESRALLELSVLRGIADEDLAQVLGVDEERVRERRDAVFSELGAESEQERASVAALVREGDSGAQAARPEAEAQPEPKAERRGLRVALLGGLAIAVAVVAAMALDEDERGTVPPAPGPRAEQAQGPPPEGPGGSRHAELRPRGRGGGRGGAKIVGPPDERRVRLVVRGLPDPASGGYVVWLYDSISDARPLTGARRGSFAVQEPLPRSAKDFRFLDVSREPADGNPNHSGESFLRVPLERLR